MPVPKGKRTRKAGRSDDQSALDLRKSKYSENAIVNEIRRYVEAWRALPNPNDWGVTPATQRLLHHWRHHEYQGPRPFFCQVEAVETLIWLTEVARNKSQYAHLFRDL